IRDKLVTGVQTCALPISNICWDSVAGNHRLRLGSRLRYEEPNRELGCLGRAERLSSEAGRLRADVREPGVLPMPTLPVSAEPSRSEERRVGKECRSRSAT